jgi:hypothetical protein
MTYREQFDSAMKCGTKEEAQAWLAQEILRYQIDYQKDEATARKIIVSSLGYMAGYYDRATSERIHELFGAEHPVFGKPDYWERVTPEQAVEAGRMMAKGFKP